MENQIAMTEKRTTLHALKWSTLGHILPQVVRPLISIYIARLLTPEAYGLVAIATIVISLLQMFLATGFTTALIQKRGNKKEIYSTADFIFGFNLVMSCVFYLIIFLSSSAIAQFFHNSKAQLVVSVLSVSLVIRAFGNVQLAMLQKDMDFKSVFFRQIAPIGSQLTVTLPLASMGLGVWALVAGILVSDVLAAVILWWKSAWKPRFNFSFRENIDIIRFGLYVIFTSLIGWTLVQGDSLIVGRFLSTKELGLYRTGYDLDNRIFGMLISPILPVFYSKFCSLEANESIREFYTRLKEYLSILVFPLMAGIILISPYFEHLILGEKWKGISFAMALLTITGISNLWALMGNMFKSLGKPEIPARITLTVACIYIPLWLFFIQFGLKTFLIARIFIALVSISINTYFENRELNINVLQSLKFYYRAFFASITMFVVGVCFQEFLSNNYNLFSLFSLISVSITTYCIMIYIFSKEQVLTVKNILVKELFK